MAMLQQQEEQPKQSGSDYSRINYHPARAMMPIPPDIVASNNSNNRTRPAIGVKPIPPPKPFPRPPPSVRPPAALPSSSSSSSSSSSVSSSCYVTASNSQQPRRRPLTCVNDMAQNPLYMCRLSICDNSCPDLSKLVFSFKFYLSTFEIQFGASPLFFSWNPFPIAFHHPRRFRHSDRWLSLSLWRLFVPPAGFWKRKKERKEIKLTTGRTSRLNDELLHSWGERVMAWPEAKIEGDLYLDPAPPS